MLRLALLVAFLIAAYSLPAHAASRSYVSVMVTDGIGQPLVGQGVKATPVDSDGRIIIVMATDANGIAQLGDLADGLWEVEACGQTITTESTDGPNAGLINVTCHRSLLPVISK